MPRPESFSLRKGIMPGTKSSLEIAILARVNLLVFQKMGGLLDAIMALPYRAWSEQRPWSAPSSRIRIKAGAASP